MSGQPSTAWFEPQIGSFGQVRVNIPINGRLDTIATSKAAGGLTLTLTLRLGGSVSGFAFDPGTTPSFDGRTFATVQISAADSNSFWSLVGHDAPPTWGGSSRPGQFGSSPPSVIELKAIAPQSLANGSAEAVITAGVAVVPQNTLVRFNLEMSGPLVTAADVVSFVAVKGHTTGTRYAIALVGTAVSGSFRAPNAVAEAMDLVAANQDTVAHGISGTQESVAGE